MSTTASRAWLAVAFIGFTVIALVLVLGLVPRLGAGQTLLDEASPAFAGERADATRAGVDLISEYVDFADPLVSARGGARNEFPKLISLMRRRGGLSGAQARRALARRAPRAAALVRALPLSSASGEVPRLTQALASALVTTPEEAQALLVRDYPQLAQTLAALRNVASGWNGVPGVDGRLTRLDGKPVSTAPGLRDYLRDDLVPLVDKHRSSFQELAGSGGIGYIPYLLLVVGLVVFAYGIYQARAATRRAPGKLAWGVVVAVGVTILAIVVVFGYFPRLSGGSDLVDDFEPVFAQERVDGAVAGGEFIHQTVLFGDPIATSRGGARPQLRRLERFVADRSALSESQVRRTVRRAAPRIVALIEAAPLAGLAEEVPRLESYLSRRLDLRGRRLPRALKKNAPGLARSLESVQEVGAGWKAIPGTAKLTRFDGVTPVRTVTAFDDYIRGDLLQLLPDQRENFDELAGGWPPLGIVAPLLTLVGALVALCGLAGMRFATPRYR